MSGQFCHVCGTIIGGALTGGVMNQIISGNTMIGIIIGGVVGVGIMLKHYRAFIGLRAYFTTGL